MNLTWHLLRKDLRQFRVFLILWGGLLLLDLAVNLGWAGQVSYDPNQGFSRNISNTWTMLLPVVLWIFVGLLPGLVVLTDSPANREGFLAVRPMLKRDVLFAKSIFILGLIVAPWVLSETIHLALRSLPSWVIWGGTLQRLSWAFPVAVGCGTFAALWPDATRLGRALGGLVFGYVLIGITYSLLANYHFINLRRTSGVANILALYVLLAALFVFMLWHSRRHRSAWQRWGGLALVTLCGWMAAWLLPESAARLRPQDQAAAEKILAGDAVKFSPRSFDLQRIQDARSGKQRFNVNVTPRLEQLPPDAVVTWYSRDAVLATSGGQELERGERIYTPPLFQWYYNIASSKAELAAVLPDFPEDTVLYQGSSAGNNLNPWAVSCNVDDFRLPTDRATLETPLTVKADLEGRVFRWRKLTDMPLKAGATSKDEFGSWRYIATQANNLARQTVFYVERDQIELADATDSRCSSTSSGPLTRMMFVFYDPQTHRAWLPDQNYVGNLTRGSHTAFNRYFLTIIFNRTDLQAMQSVGGLERCRLLVFEKTWTGSVQREWQSPAFTLADRLPVENFGFANTDQPLPLAEFNQRLAQLTKPVPNATRAEVSRFLVEYLALTEARRYQLSASDPQLQPLVALVPQHLDLLLDGLPAIGGVSRINVLTAIQVGATEAQKPQIIAALRDNPDLAEVLLKRGWVADARGELFQLLDSPRRLPLRALQAIATFRDPQTYPRLVEEFESSPSLELDDILYALGLSAQTQPIVARAWRADRAADKDWNPVFSQETFKLALRYGDTNALRWVYHHMDEPDFKRKAAGNTLGWTLRDLVFMPGLSQMDSQDPDKVVAWMQKHRPEDFEYSAARRQFVLKTTTRNLSASTP